METGMNTDVNIAALRWEKKSIAPGSFMVYLKVDTHVKSLQDRHSHSPIGVEDALRGNDKNR